MKRRTARIRHRASVIVIAAMLSIILLLLYAVVPRFEAIFADFDIELSWATLAVIRASHFVVEKVWLIVPLAAVSIGLLWTAFDQLDRPRMKGADPEL